MGVRPSTSSRITQWLRVSSPKAHEVGHRSLTGDHYTQRLTDRRMGANDALRMIKRRARAAGLSTAIGNHTFRPTGITVYLEGGGTIEKAQQLANQESPKTT